MKKISVGSEIEVLLKKSTKAKRAQMKVRKGELILTIPEAVNINKAIEFINNNVEALKDRLAKEHKFDFSHNATISVLGKIYSVTHENTPKRGIGISFNNEQLIIQAPDFNLENRIKRFLSRLLHENITTIAINFVKQIGSKDHPIAFKKIIIKDINTRWGSCNSKGDLAFCWKLVFTDMQIVEYVVAHEVCHLKEMNHSKNFWQLVESIYPDWRQARRWLKEKGRFLIGYL